MLWAVKEIIWIKVSYVDFYQTLSKNSKYTRLFLMIVLCNWALYPPVSAQFCIISNYKIINLLSVSIY
jgi:hypothetical protein